MSPPNASSRSAAPDRGGPEIPAAVDRAARGIPGAPDAASRRLSDKILAAFNHAYAVGAFEVADLLRSALVAGEAHKDGFTDQRRGRDPLCRADLWVAFVDARNGYRAMRDGANRDAGDTGAALAAMKDAYRRWSQG